MRLENTRTQDWGFLNDFQWSRVTGLLATKLLGEVAPPPHWNIQCDVAAEPQSLSTRVGVRIEVQPCKLNICGELESRPGWVTNHDRAVSNYDISNYTLVSERAKFLGTVLESLMLSLGPSLYEHDPRIGHQAYQAKLPLCLMLDPPGKWERGPSQFGPEVVCPLCDKAIDSTADFMWGGGNLLWVHPKCWSAA